MNRWCESRLKPSSKTPTPQGVASAANWGSLTGVFLDGFFMPRSIRTPHDSKHLNGWRGRKHRLDYTRQQADQRVCERLNKFERAWVVDNLSYEGIAASKVLWPLYRIQKVGEGGNPDAGLPPLGDHYLRDILIRMN